MHISQLRHRNRNRITAGCWLETIPQKSEAFISVSDIPSWIKNLNKSCNNKVFWIKRVQNKYFLCLPSGHSEKQKSHHSFIHSSGSNTVSGQSASLQTVSSLRNKTITMETHSAWHRCLYVQIIQQIKGTKKSMTHVTRADFWPTWLSVRDACVETFTNKLMLRVQEGEGWSQVADGKCSV